MPATREVTIALLDADGVTRRTVTIAGPLVEKVDAIAAELRTSLKPRMDLASALDWYVGEWAAQGYPAPCLAVNDHLRTLTLAAIEAERALDGGTRSGPVEDPWF